MAAAGAVAAAIARAIRASGVVVRVGEKDFLTILGRVERPLVVYAEGGFFSKKYQYLVSHKGLAFYTKSKSQLPLPAGAEVVTASQIWVP